ncbi:Uncharacterized conserved protein, contains ParB-like and HNH nuclease domains [Lentzea fradiae]|uniref:Uncharacterized conserved protein, contains ParB-like and HNH nuclease domains n=1 Tax=Lentzea fradiae TaxID=200378 RepID=A0A1G7QI97_9PSEU|nr:DUF262 domain-containing protein [Lentzea fradiae]SDF98243.1 Uncharacterized conserved protein, contains ParB-like and HNH nuclease domains [Lentzea fradiae]
MLGGLGSEQTATSFDVESLVKWTWDGRIRVPYFQRDFRWGQQDVTRLFDSIVKRYPIGSLLLWQKPAPADELVLGNLRVSAAETSRAHFVVDGQQRLVSLANALHREGSRRAPFSLFYDLHEQAFTTKGSTVRGATAKPWVVPLPVLFDLQELLRWFADNPAIGDRLDQATEIAKILRQYQVPAYVVSHHDEHVLQDIFDRMNNYGKRLTKAEVFSALNSKSGTASDDNFDFSLIADRVAADLNFGKIDENTVLRALLARRGPDVEREIRLEFSPDRKGQVDFPLEEKDTFFQEGEAALVRAVRFLQEVAGVPHITMVAYKFLLIVLTRVFAHHPDPDPRNLQLLRRWYWRTALAGPSLFKGSTTGTTRQLTNRVRPGDLSGTVQDLLATVPGNRYPLPDLGKFWTNVGEGKIVLAAWWNAGPRSLLTGEQYEQAELSAALQDSSTAANAVHTVFDRRIVRETLRSSAANRILAPDEGLPKEGIDTELMSRPLNMGDEAWATVLNTHAITPPMSELLANGRVEEFIASRRSLLEKQLEQFLQRMCEWDFENTPPLEDLVIDEGQDEDEDGSF